MWSVEGIALYCKKCGKLLGHHPDKEGYAEALKADLHYNCPRCHRYLDTTKVEYHHELWFSVRSIIWKLTHPWRLFK